MVQPTLERLRAEFLEMPGLQLTAKQTARLCGVDPALCYAVLGALVAERFLYVKPNGMYARATDGTIPRPRPARANTMRPSAFRQAS